MLDLLVLIALLTNSVFANYEILVPTAQGGLRAYNESCNNPSAGQECADNCDDAQLACIDRCLEGDLGDSGSVSECIQTCGRDVYTCVDACPCYSECPAGCPCPSWSCSELTCEDIHYDEAVNCKRQCNDFEYKCIPTCNDFDLLCMEQCQKSFSNCVGACPCYGEDNKAIGSRTLILFDQSARIFTWYSDNNEQVQGLTSNDGTSYLNFGNYKVSESCHVVYQGQHWFIGGKDNKESMITLERDSCLMKDTGFILPDPMRGHSCSLFNEKVWICAGTDHPTRCYTFNGIGFLRTQDLKHSHHYGTMQPTSQLGLVLVGGSSAGYYTSLSADGTGWTDGSNYPQSSSYGLSSVIFNDNMLVFGGSRGTSSYLLRAENCGGDINTLGCSMKWEKIGNLLSGRYYHRSVVQPEYNTILHIGGNGVTTEYMEKWTFDGTDFSQSPIQITSSYSLNFNLPEAYSIQANYCFPL